MKYLFLLFICLQTGKLTIGQKLEISIKIDTCVDARLHNKVSFEIANKDNIDYWIKTEFLPFYFALYNVKGEMIERKTTRHLNLIGNSEYTLIPKNSKVKIDWLADFFNNYDFSLNQDYYLETSYEYSHLAKEEKKKSKNSDFKLYQTKVTAKSNKFKICNI
jgi:hypothetical protein